jgi:NitT/TauT family transport system substrate-binding protein
MKAALSARYLLKRFKLTRHAQPNSFACSPEEIAMKLVSFGSAVCAVLLAVMSLGPAMAQDLRKTTLRLDYVANGYHAPFYLGVAKGFYREQGIDLQIFEGKGSANSATLVGTGADDFAFADATTTARLVAQGLPVKVVLGIFQRPTLAIFFPANRKINKPADLKGARISMCASDGMAQYVPAYLDAVQLKPSDVEFVTVDCSVKYTVVAQGKADAVASYTTAGRFLLAAVGITNSREFDYADAGVFLPSHGIVASLKAIQDNPKLIEGFNAATAKAWEAAKQDPDAATAAFMAANPLQKGREAIIRDSAVASFTYLSTPGTAGKPFGWQSPQEWEQAKAVLVKHVNMAASVSAAGFFTNDFVPR